MAGSAGFAGRIRPPADRPLRGKQNGNRSVPESCTVPRSGTGSLSSAQGRIVRLPCTEAIEAGATPQCPLQLKKPPPASRSSPLGRGRATTCPFRASWRPKGRPGLQGAKPLSFAPCSRLIASYRQATGTLATQCYAPIRGKLSSIYLARRGVKLSACVSWTGYPAPRCW
jgi:hypothetical protein